MVGITDAELNSIGEWLDNTIAPCGNDVCTGEWGHANGRKLLVEIRRLRALLRSKSIDPLSEPTPPVVLRMRLIGEDDNE